MKLGLDSASERNKWSLSFLVWPIGGGEDTCDVRAGGGTTGEAED